MNDRSGAEGTTRPVATQIQEDKAGSPVWAGLAKIFRATFGSGVPEMSASLRPRDVKGWDSFNHMNLIAAIEANWNIAFTVGELQSITNVGDIATLVDKKLSSTPESVVAEADAKIAESQIIGSTFTLELPRTLSDSLASDIEKASVYLSTELAQLSVSPDRTLVQVTSVPGCDVDKLRGKVERFITAMVSKTREIENKKHFDRARTHKTPPITGVHDELVRRGWVYEHGVGQVSLSGPALRLMQRLDARFAELYREHFGAVDRMFPAMVSSELLSRVGYFESHPNAASFVCHMVEDFDELETFRKANTGGQFVNPTGDLLASPHHCLNPAACFPCYEAFQKQRLQTDTKVLTWTGRVFRYESRNMRGLERLWEFNVRELVFIGSDDFIFEARRKAVALVAQLAEEWNLDCFIETATDAFFPTVFAERSFWQQVTDVKYEIRLAIEPSALEARRTIAGGSINLHGPFFGERFDITLPNGGPASTACVGWGLERWVLALFSQHGFDSNDWPVGLRGIFAAGQEEPV